jgi:hypothetical protein
MAESFMLQDFIFHYMKEKELCIILNLFGGFSKFLSSLLVLASYTTLWQRKRISIIWTFRVFILQITLLNGRSLITTFNKLSLNPSVELRIFIPWQNFDRLRFFHSLTIYSLLKFYCPHYNQIIFECFITKIIFFGVFFFVYLWVGFRNFCAFSFNVLKDGNSLVSWFTLSYSFILFFLDWFVFSYRKVLNEHSCLNTFLVFSRFFEYFSEPFDYLLFLETRL